MAAWGKPKSRGDVLRIDALAWIGIAIAVVTVVAVWGGR